MISALGLMGIMLGLTLALNGYPAFWFVFLVGLFVLLTGFIMWLSEYFPMTSEENAEIETYHPAFASLSTRKFGTWIFLLTEMMVFGTLLSAYLRYRSAAGDEWVPAADIIRSHLVFGVINTMALLLSSLTVVLALYAAKRNDHKATTRYLSCTFLLGALFLVIKGFEWWEMKNGHFWGEHCVVKDISHHRVAPKYEHGFWLDTSLEGSTFYITTGTHGAHVFVGLIALAYLILKANRGGYNEEYHDTLELFGLYWHYVDIVWVFVFPFFYLF
jgi:cytochrome c oxidase subunit I+III